MAFIRDWGYYDDEDDYFREDVPDIDTDNFKKEKQMNKIYESPTMVVHDDREPLTTEQAIDLLWAGKAIRINDIPDFSEENEGREFIIDITDILTRDILENQSKEKLKKQIEEYLRDYEIYRG